MEEIKIKVDISPEFEKEFNIALAKIVKRFVKELDFSLVDEILSKSTFSEEDANRLGELAKQNRLKELKSKELV